LRHDLTSTTAKPITNGTSYTTRWDVTERSFDYSKSKAALTLLTH
jgi:hypothetical protein